MTAPGPCEWCQDEPAEPVHRRSAPKLCAECREDGVERCSFCRRLWVPHTEAEEEAAADGTCPNCRRGDALDKALDYRWLHRRRPKRMKGHTRACRCYDCLFGPEGQPDPDWKEPRRRG